MKRLDNADKKAKLLFAGLRSPMALWAVLGASTLPKLVQKRREVCSLFFVGIMQNGEVGVHSG